MGMINGRLSGGEMVTVTATLTRDQWSILFMLLHHSAPMLPKPSWETTEFIIDALEQSYQDAAEGEKS